MSTGTHIDPRAAHAASDQRNAELVQSFYAALRVGDVTAAAERVYPDFVAHIPGSGTNAGEYWSIDGFKTLMSNVFAYNGGHFDVRIPVISVNGPDVFTREVIKLNRKDDPERIWTLPVSMHYKIKAGKISEMWVLPEDQRLYDEYWSGSITTNRAKRAALGAPEPTWSQTTGVSIDGARCPACTTVGTGSCSSSRS